MVKCITIPQSERPSSFFLCQCFPGTRRHYLRRYIPVLHFLKLTVRGPQKETTVDGRNPAPVDR